ncbi:SCO2322 family protein [Ornithinimicrobium cryptoxanthini]|uniref:SCO2322 family protein n=1 Tax=Ornithinimicrobium cryptoxanthini TaxID=2934161 RepID=A0ABY4YL58_9MICO|nr:SCO2322 family protein [Ornithinimicrobium cryptoxanthini]USQ77530.1 SCO2322 family protein [Ornithinimicrobium cryptoxanthini]
MTRLYRLICASVLALAVAVVAPMAAHAVAYQFWGFYQLTNDGEWDFATEGANAAVPEDGAVDGYRFAFSAGDDDERVPRDAPGFDDLCAGTAAADGMKRVGLVLDTGRDVDAPEGETPPEPSARCVVADEDATSQEILVQAVQDIRTDDSGLICGIAGFPEQGCGDEVSEPTPEQLAADEPIEIPIVDGDATEEPSATETSAEPTSEEATAETTDATTEDESTDDATSQESTEDETNAEATATDAEPTPGEADTTQDSDSGIPPWAWAVGVVLLLGILAWAASAARNRRLDAAHDHYLDEFRDDPRDGFSGHGPDDFDRR